MWRCACLHVLRGGRPASPHVVLHLSLTPRAHPSTTLVLENRKVNIKPGTKALQDGGLASNTCCRRCHLEGLISPSPAAQVQVPPSSICAGPKRRAMLPDKWTCYGEATNGCLVYLLGSISLQMISLHKLKPRSLGSLLFARQPRTGGEGGPAQME